MVGANYSEQTEQHPEHREHDCVHNARFDPPEEVAVSSLRVVSHLIHPNLQSIKCGYVSRSYLKHSNSSLVPQQLERESVSECWDPYTSAILNLNRTIAADNNEGTRQSSHKRYREGSMRDSSGIYDADENSADSMCDCSQ